MSGFMNFMNLSIWGSGSESSFGSELSSFPRQAPQTCSACFDSGKMGRTVIRVAQTKTSQVPITSGM